MNAMLDPSIVVASTQGRAFSRHCAFEGPDRSTASSHGCLILNVDAGLAQADSRTCRNHHHGTARSRQITQITYPRDLHRPVQTPTVATRNYIVSTTRNCALPLIMRA